MGGAWRDGKDGAWASLGGLKPKKAEAASTKRGRDVAQQAVLGPGLCWLSLAGWPNKTFKVARLSAQEAWHAAMPHGWLVPDLRASGPRAHSTFGCVTLSHHVFLWGLD